MAVEASADTRVRVDGKFFRLGDKKFCAKGVAYGPFAPNAAGQPFASPEQTALDFAQIRELGANLIRIYHVPGNWFLDLAQQYGLKVMVDIPWNQHLCFLDSEAGRQAARQAVYLAVQACGRHPAVFAFSVANEIPADVVRWSGAQAVTDFIDELIAEAKRAVPACLCTFTNYPSTEFLQPRNVDFVCFNVYLHQREPFVSYLARLQMQADIKPLMLGEFGVDSLREGEARKCELLEWQVEAAFRAGVAGAIVFSFTDDWWRGGGPVVDWQMGLTTRERQPKDSFRVVQRQFSIAPCFPLRRTPKVSVVVASYNGEATLKVCLESLVRLNYPDYEVILVDDGSADSTPKIAAQFPSIKSLRHAKNEGLSVARNTGIAAATGEIVAFTDADCRADEDWLYYLVGDMLSGPFVAMGGPNLLPPDDSPVAAAVMASPGGPAHVMLTDRQAEHIPGCNMAFFKWALVQIGGFDPIFRCAGDDVDICWRLQHAGHQIGLSPAAFVWHYRRSTVQAYLKQQHGYGEAEALLVRKHPEQFNSLGASIWRGRIYATAKLGIFMRRHVIYRGLFGSAGYQSIYATTPGANFLLCTTLEHYALVTLPLVALSSVFHMLWPLAAAAFLAPVAVCAAAAFQAEFPVAKERGWSRPLVALLFLLQPIVRGWARYQRRLLLLPKAPQPPSNLDSLALQHSEQGLELAAYWTEQRIDRLAFVRDLLKRLETRGWPHRADIGWSDFDVEIYDNRWSKLQLVTVLEEHPRGKQMLRCRLPGKWALRAKVGFWVLCGLELLIIGCLGAHHLWAWLLLLSLPVVAYLIHREPRKLQSVVRVLLDDMAREWGLVKVERARNAE
jgi:GT2 family glycosyltransferase